jgi:hypothetical protein
MANTRTSEKEIPARFDETMRRLMNVPPPPSGKKATRAAKEKAKARKARR